MPSMLTPMLLATLIAFPSTGRADWSSVPMAKWSVAKSMDSAIGLQPTLGVWSEADGSLVIEGKANCWDTRLVPGDQGADTRTTVGFTIEESSRVPRRLPQMQTARWAYHYGENAPGWDFGVVLRYKDPLHFYRIGISAHRGELALWDSLGECVVPGRGCLPQFRDRCGVGTRPETSLRAGLVSLGLRLPSPLERRRRSSPAGTSAPVWRDADGHAAGRGEGDLRRM